MKIVHRVSLTPNEFQRRTLLGLGLHLIESDSPLVRLVSFDVEEGHESWPKVKALIDEWKPADFVRTEFSASELEAASLHQVFAWLHGYPQPQDDFGYLKETYDLSEYCPTCGIGKRQIAPFRMKSEPKWGKKHLLQLNWVFDEFFVLPRVWEDVLEPLGVGCSPVIEHRTGKTLRSVVQLDIKGAATSALAIEGRASATCEMCGRKKYLPISGGCFPTFVADECSQICKTQEFFGSGASAWNATIVTNNVYRAIRSHKLSGVAFVPLESKGSA